MTDDIEPDRADRAATEKRPASKPGAVPANDTEARYGEDESPA